MTGTRLKFWAAVLFPTLVSLYLYRRSFRIWFLADDFAWLGLGLSIFTPGDLWTALFSPMAQGTVRTLSERLFFLVFERSFGMESLPMRLASFATFAVAQVLLVLLMRRLSGRLSIGVLASILWSLNFGVSIAMSWLSSYNQILLSALFLGAFFCFLRYAETGASRWLATSWFCYLLGFGALENIIVLPGVLLIWTWFFDRVNLRRTIPFFAPALLFVFTHLFLIPKPGDASAYRMYFDLSLLESIAIYWDWLMGASRLPSFDPSYGWVVQLSHWVLTPALLGFIGWRTWRKDYLPLFLCILSLALIAPMLPLRDHRTDYYLGSTSLGVAAMLALVPFRLPGRFSLAGFALLLLYAIPSFIVQQASFEWYLERTAPLRPFLRGLLRAAQLHPGKLIVLEGVTDAVYESSIADSALRLVQGVEVRLAPGEGPRGNPLALSPATTRAALENQTAIIYRFDGVILRDVTREWERGRALSLKSGLSPEVFAGDATFNPQFLSGWFPIEDSHRWMGAAASVRLGSPEAPNPKLWLEAYAPSQLTAFEFKVLLNGTEIYSRQHSAGPLQFAISIPDGILRSEANDLEFRSSRTVQPAADGRQLSLLFTKIALR